MMKLKHIIDENFGKYEPKDDSDKKVYTVDMEAHIKNCFAVRHEAAKASKKKIENFNSYGTVFISVIRTNRTSRLSPLPSIYITADDKRYNVAVDRDTFLISVTAYSKGEPTLQFTFQRCLKQFKNGRYQIKRNFCCSTMYKGNSKELDVDMDYEKGLNEESVAWALDDLLRTLIDINFERRSLPNSERLEIIVHEEIFDGDRRHTLYWKDHDVYDYIITGYSGKSTLVTVNTRTRSDQVPQ